MSPVAVYSLPGKANITDQTSDEFSPFQRLRMAVCRLLSSEFRDRIECESRPPPKQICGRFVSDLDLQPDCRSNISVDRFHQDTLVARARCGMGSLVLLFLFSYARYLTALGEMVIGNAKLPVRQQPSFRTAPRSKSHKRPLLSKR